MYPTRADLTGPIPNLASKAASEMSIIEFQELTRESAQILKAAARAVNRIERFFEEECEAVICDYRTAWIEKDPQ